jgi:hypothetical protein
MNELFILDESNGIQIDFSNGEDTITLTYMIYEWNAANTFFNLVKTAIDEKCEFHSDTSFYISKDDEIKIISRINDIIKKINLKYSENLSLIDADSDLNSLHFTSLKDNLWIELNDAIHAYEQYKVQVNSDPRINAYFTFITNASVKLNNEDFLFFKTDRNFGDLCVNYSHKGKHWLEAESDNDAESINNGELHPEDKITPGGYMVFRPPNLNPFYRMNKFVNWYKQNLPNNKFSIEMAIGYLLVGKLVMPLNWDSFYVKERSDWTRLLSTYKKIVDIRTIKIKLESIPELLAKAKMNVFIE